MAETSIEWTHRDGTIGETWNPTTGCDKISPGCDHCYACSMAKRLKAMGQPKYQTDGHPVTSGPGFGLAMHPDALTIPLRWKRTPRTVFVNSMSDLGHARITRHFLARVFAVMARTPDHTYQVLTKRPNRLRRLLAGCGEALGAACIEAGDSDTAMALLDAPWPLPNVWLGTSVESADYLDRIDDLRNTPAAVRFVSAEPLLGPLPGINLAGIDWLIAGGESGPGARPMSLDWVRSLKRACRAQGTAFFVKQLGAVWARERGYADAKGGNWDHWPADLRQRSYPSAGGAVAAA